MSDVTTGKGFDSEFLTHPPRWFGRVVSKESWTGNIASEKFDNVGDVKGWGYRYKVRIFSWHTGDKNIIPDEQLVMANVVLPTTAGSGLGGSAMTPSIEPGSVVTGFFMDGMGGQEPYIDGILGNSNNNVPKQQGGQSPQEAESKKLPSPPPNVDQLSATSLKRLLNSGLTPPIEVYQAASKAREEGKAQGLTGEALERKVLAAIVKAANSPAAKAGSQSKIQQETLGYCIANNTFKDGTNPSKVPHDRIVNNAPLSIIDALHIKTFASGYQKDDSNLEVPLLDVSKKNNSPMKAVQQTIKNLLNKIELLKKKFNQASAFLGGIDFQASIKKAIKDACKDISGFIKSIVQGVKSFTFGKLNDNVRKVTPKLFPSEMPKLYDKVAKGSDTLSCVFKNIIGGLNKLICSALEKILDNTITTPACATQNFMSGILNPILGTITGALSSVLAPINGLFSGISGLVSLGTNVLGTAGSALSGAENILTSISSISNQVSTAFGQLNSIGGSLGPLGTKISGLASQLGSALSNIKGLTLPDPNLLSALDFVPGILKFFSCDTEQKKPSYNKTTQDRAATPINAGLGLFGNVSKIINDVKSIQNQIGGLVGSITNIVGQVQGLIGQGQGISSSLLSQVTGLVDQFSGVMGQFHDLSSNVSGSKSSSSCDTGPQPCGPPTVNIFGGGGIGAAANAIISPDSSSVIGFDIINPGSGFTSPPTVVLEDPCGKGSGSCLTAVIEDGKLTQIIICATGDGYIAAPDGSLGGNGYTWKEVDEGYVQTADGNYYVVQPNLPIDAKAGDTYHPPDGPPAVLKEDQTITLPLVPVTPPKPETIGIPYSVSLSLDSIEVMDGGFGYNPEDEIIITPDNGAVAKLVVNDDGTINKINIVSPGTGFTDLPEIRTNSPTGFNGTFAPVLKTSRIPSGPPTPTAPAATDKVISVIDCVGKIPPKTAFDIVPQ